MAAESAAFCIAILFTYITATSVPSAVAPSSAAIMPANKTIICPFECVENFFIVSSLLGSIFPPELGPRALELPINRGQQTADSSAHGLVAGEDHPPDPRQDQRIFGHGLPARELPGLYI